MKNIEPIDIIIKYSHIFTKENPIYDLWVGSGRNANFLAGKGYHVIGVDNDSEILDTIKHPNITKICADIDRFLSKNNVSWNFLATFSLRFTAENFIKNIRHIQNKTPMGWVNIIIDFIDDWWEFVKRWKNKDFYWLKPWELQELYADENWEIIEYYEESTKTRLYDEAWSSLYCLASFLVAIKKVKYKIVSKNQASILDF